MASKNVIQIIINAKNNTTAAFAGATTRVQKLQAALAQLRIVAPIAIAAMGAAFVSFAKDARDAALSAEAARNKLTLAAGGAEEYEKTITAAKEATRGMVSEADLANGAFVLLEMNLASSAQEAAQLANAGQILSKAFESQGASVELFNRLLANGSVVLLDNFGISQAQVQIRQAQIEATSGLSDQEARLQAIRELAITKSERLASTMTEESIAADRAVASYSDMSAAFGDLLVAQERAANASGTTASFYESITTSLKGWTSAIEANAAMADLGAKATKRLGRELTIQESIALSTGNATGELAEVIKDLVKEEAELAKQTAYVTAQEAIYEAATRKANDALAEQVQLTDDLTRAQQAQADRYSALAGGVDYASQFQDRVTPAEWIEKQPDPDVTPMAESVASTFSTAFDDAADDMANSISSAVGGAFNRLQEVVPDLMGGGDGGDQAGEFARRMAALRDGVQESDMGFLEAFKAQAGGSPIFAALLQSLEEGDQAGVASEANRLLQENMAQVLAVGLADSIKAKMAQEDIMAEAQQIVADQLGQVEKKVVNISTAAGEMKTETKGATDEIAQSTGQVIELTKEWDRILGGISGKYEDIAKNANKLNPAAQTGGAPTNATNEQLNR